MHDASKESEKHAHLIAARLGTLVKEKWRLDRLIGTGGMAAVYAATHRNGKRVAIKMLHPELARSTDVRTRFLREGYLANKVEHDGVVSIADDDFTDDGTVFLVMELLEGETLERRWERKGRRLPIVEVLSIANELLDVLAAAHAKGIVHRDIKPENVFLTHAGKLKVLDFGIARLRQLSAGPTTTQNGTAMGTPAFMAPEQARGRWDEVDARSDVWAVGATMFSLLTGRFVHQAATSNEQLLAAMTTPARPITSLLPELPPEVARVVDRALAYKTAARWPDARAMQAAVLEAFRAMCRSPEPLWHTPRVSGVDRDAADASEVDELIRRTEHGLTNAPSAAPETHVPMRRSPFVVGIGAGLLGVAITLAAFVHHGPKAAVVAMRPVQSVHESAEIPTVDVTSLPRVTDAPMASPSEARIGLRSTTDPAARFGTPSPPATGVPASLPEEKIPPPAVEPAPPTPGRSSAHVVRASASTPAAEPSASPAHVNRAVRRTDAPSEPAAGPAAGEDPADDDGDGLLEHRH